jgi:hypothetical protein
LIPEGVMTIRKAYKFLPTNKSFRHGMDFTTLTETELLQTHARVIDELLRRGVVRTGNNPLGDFTEWLVCDRLGLVRQPNSRASYDGIDAAGIRYQIKGRRSRRPAGDVQLSVIRNLEHSAFEYLIAVVFHSDYTIRFAAKIPHAVVSELATYRRHVNGHVLMIREDILERRGVVDITSILVGESSRFAESGGDVATDQAPITRERIDELLRFLPVLTPGPGSEPEWRGGSETQDGVITMPYPKYPPAVEEFFRLAAQDCWCDFRYASEPAGEMVRDDVAIASSSLAQIRTMLTFCVRGERFCDGHWDEMIREGRIGAILRRLSQLRGEAPDANPGAAAEGRRDLGSS